LPSVEFAKFAPKVFGPDATAATSSAARANAVGWRLYFSDVGAMSMSPFWPQADIQPFMSLLSHYTGKAGLEGIARSKCIRATMFSQLNDKREVEYGYVEFFRRGFLGVFDEFDKVMPRLPGAKIPIEAAERSFKEIFWKQFEGEKGSEPLYVTSFARGKTNDHDNRGMLTLWDRYTHLEGYCLQFREKDVRRIIELEATRRHYAFLALDNVHYGMDEGTTEYRELAFQMKQLLLIEVLKGRPQLPIKPAFDQMWAFDAFAARMLRYIAKHKDPFFEDERETRIIGVPAKVAQARIFSGPALVKQPKRHPDGRSYIGIGEDWRPGLEPCRIIVGPRANRDLSDVLPLFDAPPEVITAEFPI
jgi:hypothetical protein